MSSLLTTGSESSSVECGMKETETHFESKLNGLMEATEWFGTLLNSFIRFLKKH